MKLSFSTLFIAFSFVCVAGAQTVDYSVVSVPEETGVEFTQISQTSDYVCMPQVKRSRNGIGWFANRVIDVSADGSQLAYLAYRNNTSNIFIKDINRQSASIQKTNRSSIVDFSFSPDGKNIVFSEIRGKMTQVFQTPTGKGVVCRQITSANTDYSPIYSSDCKQIFFARQENNGMSIWSYDVTNNFLANYSQGFNPCPVKGETAFVCVRTNSQGGSELWKINYSSGVEECIVSNPNHNFTSPTISPDGEWLLFVGSSKIESPNVVYYNTDLFVCRIDGTDFVQLTYHAADDLSPAWSKDGRYIYFVSQRGNKEGKANIWRMDFNHTYSY